MSLIFLDLYNVANSEIRKEKMSSLLYGKLSRTFMLLLSTLHCRVTTLNRGPVNHATHELLGRFCRYLLFLNTASYRIEKKWRSVNTRKKKLRKINKQKIFKVKGVSDIAQNRFFLTRNRD